MPPDTVIVWLVAVPAVASASVAGRDGQRRIDRQRVALAEGRAGGVGDVDREARRPGAVGVPAEHHGSRRGVRGEVARRQPGRAGAEVRRC